MKRVVSYILWWNIESLYETHEKTIDCVIFGTLSPNKKINDENCIVDDEDDQVCEQMVSMSSVAVASDRLIVTFMGTPPNCATGYREDTVSQIMLWVEKMIMIIVVLLWVHSLLQNFSKCNGTFLHIPNTNGRPQSSITRFF